MLDNMLRQTKKLGSSRSNRFAVVDVETTGLFPKAHDRVVEIAVVQIDDGNVSDEFVTLVNPQRDVGPTRIHGITAREVLNAPVFAEIAGDVVCRLADRVFVAHNAPFDHGFVAAECARIGYYLPSIPTLCTMRLAGGCSLDSLCLQLNINRDRAHSALDDARATAKLLEIQLFRTGSTGTLPDDLIRIREGPSVPWPDLVAGGRTYTRQHAAEVSDPPYLSRLIERLPLLGSDTAEGSYEYVDLLNRVLEDRKVTQAEAELLYETATNWGLTREQATTIHRDYLRALAEAALEDAVVTEVERSDLNIVAQLLGLDVHVLDDIMASTGAASTGQRIGLPRSTSNQLLGMCVCFTGESRLLFGGEPLSRMLAERMAVEAGMVVKGSVSKALDLLVAVDPDSLSGKAQKARQYGTRVMAETVFWRLVGVEMQ